MEFFYGGKNLPYVAVPTGIKVFSWLAVAALVAGSQEEKGIIWAYYAQTLISLKYIRGKLKWCYTIGVY